MLIKINKNDSSLENEKLGSKFYNFIKENSIYRSNFFEDNFKDLINKNEYFIDEFLHGARLKSYKFDKYKIKKKKLLFEIDILFRKKTSEINRNKRFNSIIDGTNFTKDLVSEPGNVLHPDEYAKRLLQLRKIGLNVTIYDQKKLKKLGMNALLGVGQGSVRGSYLVTIEWKGSRSKNPSVCRKRCLL